MSDSETNVEVDQEDSDSNEDIEMVPSVESYDLEKYNYEILGPEKIVSEMVEKINSVNLILQIPNTTTRILLHYFKWDEEKLLEDYFTKDKAAIFKAAGLVDPSDSKSEEQSEDSKEFCVICLSPFSSDMMTGLECGHRFCGDCWAEYLTVKVMLEGECLSITCPEHKCDILVDDASAMALIKDAAVRSKYQRLITQSFVECNRLLKWCPAPGCDRVVKVQEVEFKPVKCHCGWEFCFKCSEMWHAPILCDNLRKWEKTAAKDSATSYWIGMHTKDCPKCHMAIEKSGGCNHMTCKNCKNEFCWVCSDDWAHHNDNYSCNRFEVTKSEDDEETNRSKLFRVLFYYDRYINYKETLERDKNLSFIIGETMSKFLGMGMSWMEFQFLYKAFEVLRQCRVTLMYSYPFAYYVESCNQMEIFIENQADLEIATEDLAEYLEYHLRDDSELEIKQNVRDKTAYCQDRRKVLLHHVHEGYDKDWWKDEALA